MRLARGNNKQYAQPSPTNLSPNHHHRRPNGAGKTTFAKEFLRHEANCQTFINADLIASGLSPFAPELAAIQAGKLMLAAIDQQVILKKPLHLKPLSAVALMRSKSRSGKPPGTE